ncbi:MAG: AAA family ATPase [Deltaproteobacteria bacterium]|nr:AAA family ATPase [Deltaproteobacteria bacterium]
MSLLFNPALLPPDQITLAASLRRPLVERLLRTLRRIGDDGAPQHQLVLGAPGSGKTMLLRALRSAIEDDPELSARWLPVTFPEAQWDVARPADVWDNALDYLVVALERRGQAEAAAALSAQIEALRRQDDESGRRGLELLLETADRLGRRLVLLIDTLDVVLERLKKDQWHVREILAAEPRLLVIGASARAIEATYRYDAAFYDFFQLHELRPLPGSELAALLAQLPPSPDRDALVALPAATLAATTELVGSQPRTLMMLAHSLRLDGPRPVRDLVMAVLDRLTAQLQGRMEALSPQAQQVVHAVAAAWHPSRPSELAERAHLTPNAVSSQLHRLVQDGQVERVPLPPARHGFQLVDRVFQIWLLMRMGQPHRRRLQRAADMLEAALAGRFMPGFDPETQAAASGEEDSLQRVAPELRRAFPARDAAVAGGAGGIARG